jgi:hypothetical protein
MAPRLPIFVASLLLLAATGARAEESSGALSVLVRGGVLAPARLTPSPAPDYQLAPSLELGVSAAVTPWLAAELGAGYSQATIPVYALATSDPTNPGSPTVWVRVQGALTTVPIMASVRLAWPTGAKPGDWLPRPYLLAGGGVIHGGTNPAGVTGARYSGWGPEWHAGIGADARIGARWTLGLEARWRWAHADLRRHGGTSTLFGALQDSVAANLGGVGLVAAAGRSF